MGRGAQCAEDEVFWLKKQTVIVLPILMVVVWTSGTLAFELEPVDQERAEFAIAGAADARERLQSGVFKATGRLRERDFPDDIDASLSIFGAFDVAQMCSRFDFIGPGNFSSIGRAEDGFTRLDLRLVRTRDKLYRYLGNVGDPPGSTGLDVHLPTDDVGPDECSIDARLIGIFGFPRPKATFEVTIERFRNMQKFWNLSSVASEGKGILRLEWQATDARQICFIDEESGYSPIRWELHSRDSSTSSWPKDPVECTDLTWKQVNSNWVVESVRFVIRQGIPKDLSLEFTWEHVNEAVPAELFTPESLALNPETQIIDVRLGTVIVDGTIGDRDYVAPNRRTSEASDHAWMWIIGLNVAVVFAAIAILLRQRSLRR